MMHSVFPFLKNGAFRRTATRLVKESKGLRRIRQLQPEQRLWSRKPGGLPGFLVIGAQRSGSTFMHDVLALNTSARSSPLQKELHYFDNKYYRGLEWYAKFFDGVEGESPSVLNFETSPYYLYNPAVPARIRVCLPGVKVLAVLRTPVDRSISQYKWIRQVGLETRGAAEAFRYDARRLAWEQDPAYLKRFEDPLYFDFDHIHYGYLRRSLYHVQLRRWLQHFDPSQIRVVSSASLFERPQAVAREVADFLGVQVLDEWSTAAVNQNSSREDIPVSAEARSIVERELEGVEDEVRSVVTPSMVIGENSWLT